MARPGTGRAQTATCSPTRRAQPIVRQMVDALKDQDRGELDYAWRNPVTRTVESKHTQFRKVGDLLVGVGYYTR